MEHIFDKNSNLMWIFPFNVIVKFLKLNFVGDTFGGKCEHYAYENFIPSYDLHYYVNIDINNGDLAYTVGLEPLRLQPNMKEITVTSFLSHEALWQSADKNAQINVIIEPSLEYNNGMKPSTTFLNLKKSYKISGFVPNWYGWKECIEYAPRPPIEEEIYFRRYEKHDHHYVCPQYFVLVHFDRVAVFRNQMVNKDSAHSEFIVEDFFNKLFPRDRDYYIENACIKYGKSTVTKVTTRNQTSETLEDIIFDAKTPTTLTNDELENMMYEYRDIKKQMIKQYEKIFSEWEMQNSEENNLKIDDMSQTYLYNTFTEWI